MSTQSTTVSTSLLSKPARTGNSRAHLALLQLEVELADPKHEAAFAKALKGEKIVQIDYVAKIIEENQTEWNALLNNVYCQQMADGTANLDGFKWYNVQDMIFLKKFVYWKLGYYSKAPWADVVAKASKSISDDVNYVQDAIDVCVNDLKIPKDVVLNTKMADITQEFHDFLVTTVADGDWLCLNVLMLPCVMAYYEIALKFINNPKYTPADRETVFWKDWILANDPGSDQTLYKYKNIVNALFAQYDSKEDWARLNAWFKRMCHLETKFFLLAQSQTL